MKLKNKRILVTGAAGFIGFHLCQLLIKSDAVVYGVDNISEYYDVKLKHDRLAILQKFNNFNFSKIDLCCEAATNAIVSDFQPEVVVHLAAQAGVRYSIDNPRSYFESNLGGTFNLLEAIKNSQLNHFLMASTSSVYGSNEDLPFSENQKTDTQMSFYAATKKAAENITHSYSHIHNLPVTMFRFFTVYGPWGRPDMALFKFTKAILDGRPIDVYNNGEMSRDFTYVTDLVRSISRLITAPPLTNCMVSETDSVSNVAPWRVVNIGNSQEQPLMSYIQVLEEILGKKAVKRFMPMQQGDVRSTLSNCELLHNLTREIPNTNINEGIKNFVDWYLKYYDVKVV